MTTSGASAPEIVHRLNAFTWAGRRAECALTSEFLPTGLIPDMSRDLGVSIPLTGQLVTIFAATVVIAATAAFAAL